VAPSKLLDRDDDTITFEKTKSNDGKRYKEEGDFLYGHVSGTSLEEFVVTKINRKNKA
jgi:hypothetical protein